MSKKFLFLMVLILGAVCTYAADLFCGVPDPTHSTYLLTQLPKCDRSWSDISQELSQTPYEVILDSDLDFADTTFTNYVIKNAQKLVGNGHTIKNLNIEIDGRDSLYGFIGTIGTALSSQSENNSVENITFENISVTGNVKNGKVGIIGGKLLGSTGLEDLDILIKNSKINVTGTSNASIGGVFGKVIGYFTPSIVMGGQKVSVATNLTHVKTENVSVKCNLTLDKDRASVGGFAGHLASGDKGHIGSDKGSAIHSNELQMDITVELAAGSKAASLAVGGFFGSMDLDYIVDIGQNANGNSYTGTLRVNNLSAAQIQNTLGGFAGDIDHASVNKPIDARNFYFSGSIKSNTRTNVIGGFLGNLTSNIGTAYSQATGIELENVVIDALGGNLVELEKTETATVGGVLGSVTVANSTGSFTKISQASVMGGIKIPAAAKGAVGGIIGAVNSPDIQIAHSLFMGDISNSAATSGFIVGSLTPISTYYGTTGYNISSFMHYSESSSAKAPVASVVSTVWMGGTTSTQPNWTANPQGLSKIYRNAQEGETGNTTVNGNGILDDATIKSEALYTALNGSENIWKQDATGGLPYIQKKPTEVPESSSSSVVESSSSEIQIESSSSEIIESSSSEVVESSSSEIIESSSSEIVEESSSSEIPEVSSSSEEVVSSSSEVIESSSSRALWSEQFKDAELACKAYNSPYYNGKLVSAVDVNDSVWWFFERETDVEFGAGAVFEWWENETLTEVDSALTDVNLSAVYASPGNAKPVLKIYSRFTSDPQVGDTLLVACETLTVNEIIESSSSEVVEEPESSSSIEVVVSSSSEEIEKPESSSSVLEIVESSSSVQDFTLAVAPGEWKMVNLAALKRENLLWDGDEIFFAWDEATKQGEYLQYKTWTSEDDINPVQGYWYNSLEGRALDFEESDVEEFISYSLDSVYSGWNMISNPYGRIISLDAFENEDLYVWRWNAENASYEVATELQPFEGAWVQVGAPKEIQVSSAPVPLKKETAKVLKRVQSLKNWQIQVTLKDNRGKLDAWNVLGVGEPSKIEEPPQGMGAAINLSIIENKRALAKSIQEVSSENSWELKTKLANGNSGVLVFDGIRELNAMGLYAYAITDTEIREIKANEELKVANGSVITVQVSAEKKANQVVQKFFNFKAFPRDGFVNVTFDVSANYAGTTMSIELLDIQGKQIARSSHKAVKGANALVLPANKKGLYFVIVKAKGLTEHQKIWLR